MNYYIYEHTVYVRILRLAEITRVKIEKCVRINYRSRFLPLPFLELLETLKMVMQNFVHFPGKGIARIFLYPHLLSRNISPGSFSYLLSISSGIAKGSIFHAGRTRLYRKIYVRFRSAPFLPFHAGRIKVIFLNETRTYTHLSKLRKELKNRNRKKT